MNGLRIPVGRRAKIFTAEDAEGAEGKRERIEDGRSIASLVFSAFFSACSASSAVKSEWIAALPRWDTISLVGTNDDHQTSSEEPLRERP
jgi:hypothetical protein